MPVHDWTRVRPGTFHHFHCSWITHLSEALNGGLLPDRYYAMSEQPAGETGPDVLTLEAIDEAEDDDEWGASGPAGAVAVADSPPKVSHTVRAEMAWCAARRRTLVIRHTSGDRIVAFVEILSPGNKSKQSALEAFLNKAQSALKHGHHLLLIDLFPPGRFDPNGIHGALWTEIDDPYYEIPAGKNLTLAAYTAELTPSAYVEPIAVGQELPEMPLFLTPALYVNVPLEQTYLQAWAGVPQRWKSVVEGK